MKKLTLWISLSAAAIVQSGCGDSRAETSAGEAESAASYKAGHGLRLTPAALEFAGVRTKEVSLRAAGGGREVLSVPGDAVLRTVRGDFVFVENGGWFLLTPVVTGATGTAHVEIKEGLYEGDFVVTRGVRQIALAEIQALNGGVGCADGH